MQTVFLEFGRNATNRLSSTPLLQCHRFNEAQQTVTTLIQPLRKYSADQINISIPIAFHKIRFQYKRILIGYLS